MKDFKDLDVYMFFDILTHLFEDRGHHLNKWHFSGSAVWNYVKY